MPITMRPFVTSCVVAYQLAVIVGSRMPGIRHAVAELERLRLHARDREQGVALLPEDVRVVGPAVLEAEALAALKQLDQPRVRRVRQGRQSKAEHLRLPEVAGRV